MQKKSHRFFQNIREQSGLSLIEVLLVVGIVAVLGTGIVELANRWANSEKNLSAARHLRIVHNAAEAYIRDNFASLLADLRVGTGVLEIPIDDTGGLTYFLKEGGVYLPLQFNAQNSYMQRVTVLVRDSSPTANVEDERIEAVVVSSGRAIALDDAIDIAQAVGISGGVIAGIDAGSYSTTAFNSSYGGWTTTLANYGGLAWGAANTPIDSDKAHIVAFIELNRSDVMGDYLYRVAVPDSDEANRMQTNLFMGGNTFNNVALLDADRVNVDGNLTIQNVATVTGGAILESAVNVGSGMFVEGLIELGNLSTLGNVTTPTLVVSATLTGSNNTQINATTLTAGDVVGAESLNVVSVNMNNGDITSATGGVVSVGTVSGVSVLNAGAVGAGSIQNPTINQLTSDIFFVNQAVEIDGNLVVNGTISNPSGRTAIGDLQNCFTVSGGLCQ